MIAGQAALGTQNGQDFRGISWPVTHIVFNAIGEAAGGVGSGHSEVTSKDFSTCQKAILTAG
jgi:hypothetical protein